MKLIITDLIQTVKRQPDCEVCDPCGLPLLASDVELPNDLITFYENCGGMSLFIYQQYMFSIVSPKSMVLANPVLIGDLCEEDISSKWYIIGKYNNNNYVSIDLAKERLGRCYDSFWDRHGVAGSCTIVASSFTQLLTRLFDNKGKSIFWLDKNFSYIGDAYDNS